MFLGVADDPQKGKFGAGIGHVPPEVVTFCKLALYLRHPEHMLLEMPSLAGAILG